jgi:opacity protein-like surface antigen
MKRVIGIAVLAAAISAGAAHAQSTGGVSFEKPFAELGLGITSSGDYQFGGFHYDDDRSLSGRLSFGFENFIGPLELRADYLSTSIGGIFEELDISSFMVSGVLNREVNDWLTVYAGGGAGVAMSDYTGGSLSQYPGRHTEDTQPTWMAMAGVRAQLFNSPASIFLEGQYQGAGDFEIAPNAIAEYSVLGAMTGLRWNF